MPRDGVDVRVIDGAIQYGTLDTFGARQGTLCTRSHPMGLARTRSVGPSCRHHKRPNPARPSRKQGGSQAPGPRCNVTLPRYLMDDSPPSAEKECNTSLSGCYPRRNTEARHGGGEALKIPGQADKLLKRRPNTRGGGGGGKEQMIA